MSTPYNFKGRDEYRKQQELDEARKAGLAPAERDEDGKEINPHIPQYMASAPWYLNNDRPSLKHQRKWKEGQASDVYKRDSTYEGKRDRWAEYDADDYQKVVERYERIEAYKKQQKKEEELKKALQGGGDTDGKASNKDDAKIDESEQVDVGATVEKRVRTVGGGSTGSVRNLRIREDTAKYLLNLDVNSAHYDPKTRSMRADPQPDKPADEKTYFGDNFWRYSGQVKEVQALNVHAWEASQRGQNILPMASPSQAELLFQTFKERKDKLKTSSKDSLKDKYGNAAAKKTDDVELLAQTEQYVEYDRTGKLVNGAETKAPLSKYEEDVYPNNHTSVWGSWCVAVGGKIQWGFACCHSTVKNSYCLGEAGKSAANDTEALVKENMDKLEERKAENAKATRPSNGVNKDIWGTDTKENLKLSKKKLREALEQEEERQRNGEEKDERKRGYNVTYDADVTEEQMEAFRMKRVRAEDPMANFIGKDHDDV
mmetsp:Transcript_11554/g.42262  ORF Transcript_11554/g.42262 Transcript_11554/m.42262 type:complete len:486 (+) Transcript_11554:173-1630(+)|eukprot:scaffold1315_cov405-Prasinococcus_capsulatus_cf.AAC.17